ncbi:MAG: hypothetical protein M0Z94_02005 [Dehalococcoidales bacterium]|nr:hypothetical protein [Dehalococcoidales bacterium]
MTSGDSTTIGSRRSRLAVRHFALAAIVTLYVAFGVAYTVKTPKWNNPDEPAHFNYLRQIAMTGTLPVLQQGDYDQHYLEQLKPAQFPDPMPIDGIRYESHQPPLYYILSAGLYDLTEGLSLNRQILILRSFSVLLGALVLLAGYKVVREALPGSPLLAVGTVAFVAGVPMHIAMSAALNNDTLAELVLVLILLVALSGVRRGFTYRRSVLLGVLLGAALLTKVTIYSSLALAPAALLARWWLMRRSLDGSLLAPVGAGGSAGPGRTEPSAPTYPSTSSHFQGNASRPVLSAAGGAGSASRTREPSLSVQLVIAYGTAGLLSAWWFVRNALTYGGLDIFGLARHDAVVIGQPRTVYDLAGLNYFVTTTFRSFWAQFGWMGVLVDSRIYLALALLSAAATVGFAILVWRLSRPRAPYAESERLALALLGLCAVLVFGELIYYNLTFIQAQGRYLFPAIVPIGLFFVAGLLSLVPRLLAPVAVLGLYLALLALDYVCLFRFIAPFFGTL